MNILITGIHGFVGSNLVAALKERHNLYGLDIVAPAKEGVIKTFSWKDIEPASFPLQSLPKFDAIVHLAGKAHDTKNQAVAQTYFDINTGLTRKIFDFFIESSAQKFVFFSSVKAAADSVVGDMLTEDVVPAPVGPYGESKIKAEEYILDGLKAEDGKLKVGSRDGKGVYILRPCMIHGPGNKGNLNLLYNVVRKGIPWPLGSFENRRSFTSIDNLCYVVEGLLTKEVESFTEKSLSGLLNLGGTMLGTSREKPFRKQGIISDVDKPALIQRNIAELGLDCVVCIGGNGTQKTAAKFAAMGINIVSVPKTIDNDIWGTDISFGFDSAVSIATDAIDRLHSTASSHKRVMVIEVMGHKAGWIALYSGMAGGGDVILVPEIPYNIKNIGDTILNRLKKGKPYSIVVVAEGIQTDGRKRAAEYIAQEIEYETGIETRETVLGYIQRGGSPTPFDRNLSTRMGGHATELIANGQFGRMIALKGDEISSVALEEVAGKLKLVTEEHDLVVQGRRMGICFG